VQEFDLIVIGAGPGGYVAAIKAAQFGMSVAVIEQNEIGGTCLNRGCIPTKSLLYSAHLYNEIKNCGQYGVTVEGLSYDMGSVYKRKDEVVSQLRGGVQSLLRSNKITIINGPAKIINAKEVCVTPGGVYNAKNILIATGAVPANLKVPGASLPNVITSDELLGCPGYKKIIIIGGGVIGAEFAEIYSSFGASVTIIESMPRILPTMDREISQSLAMVLKKRGVKIFTSAAVELIEECEGGLTCFFTQKEKGLSESADAIVVAVGRRAAVEGLFADGVEVDFKNGLVVDGRFQTNIEGVYAVGDVISGGVQLAHVASAQAAAAVSYMAGKKPDIDLSTIPSCIYTNPEIASVGITEEQAKENGLSVKTGKYLMNGNGRTVIESQGRGFIKVISHADTGVILGAQLMCARATDIAAGLVYAISNKLQVGQLASAIHPHPTFCEGVLESVEDIFGTAAHMPPKRF
jgi:dihydrolipoamide dehydrogenase